MKPTFRNYPVQKSSPFSNENSFKWRYRSSWHRVLIFDSFQRSSLFFVLIRIQLFSRLFLPPRFSLFHFLNSSTYVFSRTILLKLPKFWKRLLEKLRKIVKEFTPYSKFLTLNDEFRFSFYNYSPDNAFQSPILFNKNSP